MYKFCVYTLVQRQRCVVHYTRSQSARFMSNFLSIVQQRYH